MGKSEFNERGLRTDGKASSAINDPVRHFMGLAKQWSSKRLIRAGLCTTGVWSRRGKIVHIRDRQHQLNVYRYIEAHRMEGAAVWTARSQR